MFFSSTLIRWLVFFLVLTLVVVYFLTKKPQEIAEKILEIPLKSGGMINWLKISNKYDVEDGGKYITIHVEYPDFKPNYPKDSYSMDKALRILLDAESEAGKGGVENFLKHVKGEGCDSDVNCYAELVEKTEQYEIFKDAHAGKSKYYYFKAYDGKFILLEDSGDWSMKYHVKRNIDGYLHIEYLFPKKLGDDFVKMDKEITEFVKNHLKFEHFKKG